MVTSDSGPGSWREEVEMCVLSQPVSTVMAGGVSSLKSLSQHGPVPSIKL